MLGDTLSCIIGFALMDTLRWSVQSPRCIALLSLLYTCVVTALLYLWFSVSLVCDSILLMWAVDIAAPGTCDDAHGGGANATTVEEVVLLPTGGEGDSAGSW